MEVGEVPKGIRWSAKAGGPSKVRIGGVSGRGRGPTLWNLGLSNKDALRSLVRDLKLLKAIKTSWDHVSMIVQEDGGLKAHFGHFASCLRIFTLSKFLYYGRFFIGRFFPHLGRV